MRIKLTKNIYFIGCGLILLVVGLAACTLPGGSNTNPCPPDCEAIDPGSPLGSSTSVCGAACDPLLNLNCTGGLTCISGTCIDPVICMGCGQPCDYDSDCPPEFECGDYWDPEPKNSFCYNKSLCMGADPAGCGVVCTGDTDCATGLECYGWGTCTNKHGPSGECEGAACGLTCGHSSDCDDYPGVGYKESYSCVMDAGFCGGTHTSVCGGCGAACETNADCPGNLNCTDLGYHGDRCWADTCESVILDIPIIPELVVTEDIIGPPGGPVVNPPIGPVNPVSEECMDDGMCTEGEQSIGSCRDCSTNPGDLCGVPCSAGCEGGLECVNGVCWSGPICNPDGDGDGDGDEECSCACVEVVPGVRRCTDTCTGASC